MFGKAEMTLSSGKSIATGMTQVTADRCWGCISLSPSASNLGRFPEWELIAVSGGGMFWGDMGRSGVILHRAAGNTHVF